MNKRLRVVGWRIQPVVMVDDGENLTSLQVNPLDVPAEHWQGFKDGGDEQALAQLRSEIEQPDEPPKRRARPKR